MEKRAVLEQKRKKWMNDRNQILAREENKGNNNNTTNTTNQRIHSSHSNQINNNNNTRRSEERERERGGERGERGGGNIKSIKIKEEIDEALVSQLTERITKEIRKEINIGIGTNELRDAMTEKMDKYLESELHTHLCKVCSNLMLSPNNTPMLLFPCGHTFCKMCCEKGKQIIAVCPYCRLLIYLFIYLLLRTIII